ncbi:hypothetical protein SKAU_G00036070 [Synaphobranchus kaupii]|uniref:Uncharacterized protein n=1 Tax=Synaphobranchus kaupii TaxID=118154 RepID=A0A9Q1JH47_SYNKA|nr:hypothetical protein SKAU_G00036070 [Synaphobranchus kaupii]
MSPAHPLRPNRKSDFIYQTGNVDPDEWLLSRRWRNAVAAQTAGLLVSQRCEINAREILIPRLLTPLYWLSCSSAATPPLLAFSSATHSVTPGLQLCHSYRADRFFCPEAGLHVKQASPLKCGRSLLVN